MLARLREQGVELGIVIGPSDRDDNCLDWVGAVISVTGRHRGVPTMSDAVRDGLFHPACRHTLVAFNPATVSPKRRADAEKATLHAVAAMQARAQGQEPPFLPARQFLREEYARRSGGNGGGTAGITPRQKFERVYESARKADSSGDFATALVKCRAALDLLAEESLFGGARGTLAEALRKRIHELEQLARG